jgi:peptidoglycan hydrolase CwlO-like protein
MSDELRESLALLRFQLDAATETIEQLRECIRARDNALERQARVIVALQKQLPPIEDDNE